jgi:hypothetical protein
LIFAEKQGSAEVVDVVEGNGSKEKNLLKILLKFFF